MEVIDNLSRLASALVELYNCGFGIKALGNPYRSKFGIPIYENQENITKGLIDERYESIIRIFTSIDEFVVESNKLYVWDDESLRLRIKKQNKALVFCGMLKSSLNEIASFFDIDVSVYRNSIKFLDYEIHLIKEWRKYSKRLLKS